MRRRTIVLLSVVVAPLLAMPFRRATASGGVDMEKFNLFYGAPVFALLGTAGTAAAITTFDRDHVTSSGRTVLGFGLGLFNLGLSAGYLAMMWDGGGPVTATLGVGHFLVGGLCVASSIRLLTLPRREQPVVGAMAIVTGSGDLIPGIGLRGCW